MDQEQPLLSLTRLRLVEKYTKNTRQTLNRKLTQARVWILNQRWTW